MNKQASDRAARIRELNDAFRQSFAGGKVMLTAGVRALPGETQARVQTRVRFFDEFDGDNDPHREHDFGAFELGGARFFWKIDYYDRDCRHGSEDPSDPDQTTRVLIVMLAEEY
jgi:hypothetical protein